MVSKWGIFNNTILELEIIPMFSYNIIDISYKKPLMIWYTKNIIRLFEKERMNRENNIKNRYRCF